MDLWSTLARSWFPVPQSFRRDRGGPPRGPSIYTVGGERVRIWKLLRRGKSASSCPAGRKKARQWWSGWKAEWYRKANISTPDLCKDQEKKGRKKKKKARGILQKISIRQSAASCTLSTQDLSHSVISPFPLLIYIYISAIYRFFFVLFLS